MSAAKRLAKLCFIYEVFVTIGYCVLYVKGGFNNGLKDTFFYCNKLFMPNFEILLVFPLNFYRNNPLSCLVCSDMFIFSLILHKINLFNLVNF